MAQLSKNARSSENATDPMTGEITPIMTMHSRGFQKRLRMSSGTRGAAPAGGVATGAVAGAPPSNRRVKNSSTRLQNASSDSVNSSPAWPNAKNSPKGSSDSTDPRMICFFVSRGSLSDSTVSQQMKQHVVPTPTSTADTVSMTADDVTKNPSRKIMPAAMSSTASKNGARSNSRGKRVDPRK